ncbi:pap2 haloperoxidase domain-containing protein, partial [Nannochloropsis gaditana CCMP526]|uniref:pap2 haloperoxidase domain-containing protein n=1 Tax=Nannochloropsis gaditana (strain CCMP526) TaxID=1093141 RepID=UPI00029F5CE6
NQWNNQWGNNWNNQWNQGNNWNNGWNNQWYSQSNGLNSTGGEDALDQMRTTPAIESSKDSAASVLAPQGPGDKEADKEWGNEWKNDWNNQGNNQWNNQGNQWNNQGNNQWNNQGNQWNNQGNNQWNNQGNNQWNNQGNNQWNNQGNNWNNQGNQWNNQGNQWNNQGNNQWNNQGNQNNNWNNGATDWNAANGGADAGNWNQGNNQWNNQGNQWNNQGNQWNAANGGAPAANDWNNGGNNQWNNQGVQGANWNDGANTAPDTTNNFNNGVNAGNGATTANGWMNAGNNGAVVGKEGMQTATGMASNLAFNVAAAARAYAMASVAAMDNRIVTLDNKYFFDTWRPVTAIRLNADPPQPEWEPLLVTPATPEYPSGYGTLAGAMVEVIKTVANNGLDEAPFMLALKGANGEQRNYATLSSIAEESAASRVYGGLQWAHTTAPSFGLGQQVATAVLAGFDTMYAPQAAIETMNQQYHLAEPVQHVLLPGPQQRGNRHKKKRWHGLRIFK